MWANFAVIVLVIVFSDVCGYISYYKVKRLNKHKQHKEDAEAVHDLDKLNTPKYPKDDESFEESVEDDENNKFEADKRILSHRSDNSVHNAAPDADVPVVGFANLVDSYKHQDDKQAQHVINNQLPLMNIDNKQADDFEWNSLDKQINDALEPSMQHHVVSNVRATLDIYSHQT